MLSNSIYAPQWKHKNQINHYDQNRTEQNITLLTLRLYNTTYEVIHTDQTQKSPKYKVRAQLSGDTALKK